MDRSCEACGKPKSFGYIGGTMLCRQCTSDIEEKIETLHAEGKPVNVMHIARKIFRETHSCGNFLLRDIPQDLWTAAKHRAIDDDVSLRELILTTLRVYLKPDKETYTPKKKGVKQIKE